MGQLGAEPTMPVVFCHPVSPDFVSRRRYTRLYLALEQNGWLVLDDPAVSLISSAGSKYRKQGRRFHIRNMTDNRTVVYLDERKPNRDPLQEPTFNIESE
jgi:hypothetical protein